MPFGEAKRAFLIRVLGLERVKALEDMLPRMERELEARGIGFKDADSLREVMIGYTDDEPEVMVVAPTGPTSFDEAEAADEAREEGAEVRSLTATFEMLVSNIMAPGEAEATEKVKLLAKALEELKSRVVKVGSKALANPAAPYVALLAGGGSAIKSTEVEELQGPAASLVGQLLRYGAVQQG